MPNYCFRLNLLKSRWNSGYINDEEIDELYDLAKEHHDDKIIEQIKKYYST